MGFWVVYEEYLSWGIREILYFVQGAAVFSRKAAPPLEREWRREWIEPTLQGFFSCVFNSFWMSLASITSRKVYFPISIVFL